MLGEHDDLVMALAIAHHIRPQMRCTVAQTGEAAAKWTKSMWEDYEAAGEDDRAVLLQKWGHPQGM